jgi:cellulose biosynthesis protein BcsQ
MANKVNKAAHFMLQSKGGVGKSFIATIFAQYLKSIGKEIKCVDTDPINQTFRNYKALDVQFLKLTDEGSISINSRNFDMLMERLLSEPGNFIIDNGASTFLPLSSYIVENDAINMIEDSGRDVYIHAVVTGGQALLDTVSDFATLAKQTSIKKIIVWLNEFFGAIEYNGKTFEEMKAYTENAEKVFGIIRIVRRNQDTFAKDIEQMISRKLLFSEALSNPEFSIMSRQRLKIVKDEIFGQLSTLEIS